MAAVTVAMPASMGVPLLPGAEKLSPAGIKHVVPPVEPARKLSDPLYDPFRRLDQYGDLGAKPQPWYEYLRLAVLTVVLLPFKLLALAGTIAGFWLVCKLAPLLPEKHRLPTVVALGKVFSRICLFALGFWRIDWVTTSSTSGTQEEEPPFSAVVSNHVSPCDIVVYMSRYFPSFVAKQSVKTTPLIGAISQYMGCVFVDIKAKAANKSLGLSSYVKERMHEVQRGDKTSLQPMCIFPEGTTTNGSHLIPFKTGAFLAGEPVKPHVLKYSAYHVSPAWESIPIPRLLYLVLVNPVHSVTVTELPVYVPNEAEKADPRLYANNVRQYMLDHSMLKPSEAEYKDELDYIAMLSSKAAPRHTKGE